MAVGVTSLLFGVQHLLFAPTASGMIVFFVAFTVYGLCAALIVRRQGWILPVAIAHWIISILMSSPALVLPVLRLSGLVPPS